MKVLQINTVYGIGSTGKIVKDIHDECVRQGIECVAAFRAGSGCEDAYDDIIEIGTPFGCRLHGFLARFTMFKGCFSRFSTRKLIKKLKKYAPDVIHLHNLHGSYINISLLMKYIKRNKVSVVFTFHDCWAFTAICPHFMIAGCDKWKHSCEKCPQRKKYSSAPFDFTKKVWTLKKEWFSNVEDFIAVAPSEWLAKMISQSFLKDYSVRVINNGIDLTAFSPTKSDFISKYSLENKKIVLGVSFKWSYEKGVDVFFDLSSRLPEEYVIVIVGELDEKLKSRLPKGIITIAKTNDKAELAQIYSAADVFVNPTREEVLGLVNIEALACGTPVITFDTGGSPECIDDTCGSVIPLNDNEAMAKEIIRVCSERPYSEDRCVFRAKLFDKDDKILEYVDLYNDIKKDN